jgi:hypothetical protein
MNEKVKNHHLRREPGLGPEGSAIKHKEDTETILNSTTAQMLSRPARYLPKLSGVARSRDTTKSAPVARIHHMLCSRVTGSSEIAPHLLSDVDGVGVAAVFLPTPRVDTPIPPPASDLVGVARVHPQPRRRRLHPRRPRTERGPVRWPGLAIQHPLGHVAQLVREGPSQSLVRVDDLWNHALVIRCRKWGMSRSAQSADGKLTARA